MDLSNYLKKGARSNYDIKNRERYCRQCGTLLEDKEHYLYARGFCSEECNAKYLKG
ncbi:MAG: hypothetical protein J4478_01005 [Candidatus Diapherotrites archaeon]|uniref:Uncharacterized protein n=1 Tax=Candidatus Iainarchaeum sp. TaxID=3101447 RepID=A0A7J4JXU2_9ARCH|nr:hypothetical protein [Candidatus Diapherotrites archaeon]HIH21035.1 hypothetical protein [Candidatus Diapherotrites archaeon]HIH32878.1 hypothetical protein [Candidatus Diapherotrites archaeon]